MTTSDACTEASMNAIMGGATPGTLYGVGVGPGDIRLLTLRAVGVIRSVDVIAYFAKAGRESTARRIVAPLIGPRRLEMALHYPVTTELPVDQPGYQEQIRDFYAKAAERIAAPLRDGRSVGLLGEGDPFFYGSFMHIWRRLAADFPIEIVPGVLGVSGCSSRANAPLAWGDDVLTVLPGALDETMLTRRLREADAAVIMKVGRNLAKVRRAIAAAGLTGRAIYVEHGTMTEERILPFAALQDETSPYFSIILIPGQGRRL